MGDKHHRHFAFELIDGSGEVFGSIGVQAAGGFVEENKWGRSPILLRKQMGTESDIPRPRISRSG
jgi:hypothetical protein